MDTSTTTGSLVLNLLGAVAQFEREMMSERQREGIAKAKSEGKYEGRKATSRAKADDILTMKSQGIGASVYRIMAEQAALLFYQILLGLFGNLRVPRNFLLFYYMEWT